MQCAMDKANQIKSAPFKIELDVLGHWLRPKVVWLGCANSPESLSLLVQQLNQELAICGYTPEYKEFKTHMTLMRKVTHKPKHFLFQSINWQISEFVLVESTLDNIGSQYEVLESWPLSVIAI